jgi:hypothetical protein
VVGIYEENMLLDVHAHCRMNVSLDIPQVVVHL